MKIKTGPYNPLRSSTRGRSRYSVIGSWRSIDYRLLRSPFTNTKGAKSV